MLWLERQVVATLAGDVDARRRIALEGYVDGVLRSMPEHLRLGVAAESIVLGSGEWIARRLGSRRNLADRLASWEENPIGPIRQYVRLLSSLVIFASEELAPEPSGDDESEPAASAPAVRHGAPVTTLDTEILVVGSGAGGAVTAATLARAGRNVMVVEEGPWVDPDAVEPFSLDELVLKYRHQGASAALGSPGIAYAEGRCVGGSTEINSGLYHRLPPELADEWRRTYRIGEFSTEVLDRYADRIESELSVSYLPGAPPPSSAVLERGASKLGWRAVEFSRVFAYDSAGRGVKQTMARTMLPRAVEAGAQILADCRIARLIRKGDHIVGARGQRTLPGGETEPLTIRADHVFVCGGAIQTPTLLQHSGIRAQIGNGLKFHPTIKVAARFPRAYDHGDVPMHRVTEFSPFLTIGGSASRRGHVALALADSSGDYADALANWEDVVVYYAAIRSDGSGRVTAIPGLRAPLVTYRMTDADQSRLARGLLHLGEVLLAAGATELYPSIAGGTIARRPEDLVDWWDAFTPSTANLMTVHLTSTVRMGDDQSRTGADSFGRVWGYRNLRINDASLLPDAPGVNPQAAIMAIAARNADEFLTSL